MRHYAKGLLLAGMCCASLVAAEMPSNSARVEQFSGGEASIYANAYIIETLGHVVVVDTTLLTSSSAALRAKIEATGKPLMAILITHGHPDHYNGITNVLNGSSVEVLSTAGVLNVIKTHDSQKEAQWRPVFGDQWPTHRTFPNRIVKDGQSITIDGVRFTVHDLGPGESDSDSFWTMSDHGRSVAFIGDLVLNHVHAYMTDGHSERWIKNIDRLKPLLAKEATLYPGHGDAGGVELLDWQRTYLVAYRQAVVDLAHGQSTLNEEAKKQLTTRMMEFLPSKKLDFLIPLGADPVAAELTKESQ